MKINTFSRRNRQKRNHDADTITNSEHRKRLGVVKMKERVRRQKSIIFQLNEQGSERQGGHD